MTSTAQADSKISLTASCHCQAFVFSTEVEARVFSATICHCDACRHSTGTLCTTFFEWPENSWNRNLEKISKLKTFCLDKYSWISFCPTCFSPIFLGLCEQKGETLNVLTGALDELPEYKINIVKHISLEETKDGGASVWTRFPNGPNPVPCYEGPHQNHNDEPKYTGDRFPEKYTPTTTATTTKDNSLAIQCWCGGVDFVWHRRDLSKPLESHKDYFVDEYTGLPLAFFCACDNCRKTSGSDISYTAIAFTNCIDFGANSQGLAFPEDSSKLQQLVDTNHPAIGTLKYYQLPDKTKRYACSNCSANIFHASNTITYALGVAVGVLRASDGARAENFLFWAYGYVAENEAFGHDPEDCKYSRSGWRKRLLETVSQEAKTWRDQREYPQWLRLAPMWVKYLLFHWYKNRLAFRY